MSIFNISDTSHSAGIAIATILVVVGVPHMIDEKKVDLKKFFGNSLIKKLVLFSAVYLNTKDLYISITVTVMFAFIVDVILAEPLTPTELSLSEKER